MRAQFGEGFREFGALRRRRNELEYPQWPVDDASIDEATNCVESARTIIKAAEDLIGERDLF